MVTKCGTNHLLIPKSKSTPSKLTILTLTYKGEHLAPKTSKQFLNRSISLTTHKKYGGKQQQLITPRAKLKNNRNREQNQFMVNTWNWNINASNNKEICLLSPHHIKNKYHTPTHNNQQNKFFFVKKLGKRNQKLQEMDQAQKKNYAFLEFDFTPIKIIAQGQYGYLYLAYAKQINFIVVIKAFIKQKVQINFMIDEFKIQLYCQHPNILPAYGYFFGQSKAYLIMQAGSHNLYHMIRKQSPFTETKSATYIHQVLKGLAYLHLHGIIHRDIKPQNIIVCGSVLKISDFGWSIVTEDNRKTFCGTLDYISPEVSNGKSYDKKIDCWSIGILTYQMLTGSPPFHQLKQRYDKNQQHSQHPKLNYQKPIRFPPSISKLGQEFIKKMLAYHPQLRPSATEALRDPWILSFSQQVQIF